MASGVYNFPLEFLRNSFVQKHHPSHLLNGSIFTFNNPILLRSLRSRELLLDSIFLTKFFQLWFLNSFPWSLLRQAMDEFFSTWNRLHRFSILLATSNFSLRSSTHVNLEKSSTITKIYLFPPRLSVQVRPIRSTWRRTMFAFPFDRVHIWFFEISQILVNLLLHQVLRPWTGTCGLHDQVFDAATPLSLPLHFYMTALSLAQCHSKCLQFFSHT